MREILFRGKRTDTGEWVEGDLFHNLILDGVSEKETRIGDVYFYGDEIHGTALYEVIPETVGQYTELEDSNGKRIFEGDIIKCTDTAYNYSFMAAVIFGNPNAKYNWGFQLKRISGASANTDILLWVGTEDSGAYVEVIGNIHDKTELLEGNQ